MNRSLQHAVTLLLVVSCRAIAAEAPEPPRDPRNIQYGSVIPDEGYCDQPYIVVTREGHWVCTLTTGKGIEGQGGQHVVSTISRDQGRTWSPLVDIEPADGPEASWVMPLITPSGRIYAFYDYNGDRVSTLNDKPIRADMLGWYCYRWSDDGGATWSKERMRLPIRVTAADRTNDWKGDVQIMWGIGKPITFNSTAMFGFSKLGRYMLDLGEGWFMRSDNILTEPDPHKLKWEMLPDGEHGLRHPDFGSVQEEHNIVWLGGEDLYCIYRTTQGHPCHAYSRDGGRTWTTPEYATYTPGGRRIKHPRACPRLWRTSSGNYLLWYHNHGGRSFEDRNPAWITGGVLKDGRIHWSQPEVLLYDSDPRVRMSYPDLIEQDGRCWISETQKSVARIHEVDPSLFQALWNQGTAKTVATEGLALQMNDVKQPTTANMPRLPLLQPLSGFSIDLWLTLEDLAPGQILLDSRNAAGKGVVLATTDRQSIEITLCDSSTRVSWDCDPGLIREGVRHHVGIVVDAGPRIITFVVDGQLCDGGEVRQYGWGRFPDFLRDVNGSPDLRVAPRMRGTIHTLRIYDRWLRNSQLVANSRAGSTD